MMERFVTLLIGTLGTTVAATQTVQLETKQYLVIWDVNGPQMLATLFVAIPTGLWVWRQIWMSFNNKKKED